MRSSHLILPCVALLVLVSCDGDRVTLDLAGGPETIDASVIINGETIGCMEQMPDNGSHLVKRIQRGKLEIEVTKDGYGPFRETITLLPGGGAHYVYVTLTREANPSHGPSLFDMEIFPREGRNGVVHVRLTSRNHEPVTIDKSDIPWSSVPITLNVQIFRLDDRKVELVRLIPMVHQLRRKYIVTVRPNETIEGDVNLADEFPDLEDDIKEHGVVVKWQCKVALLNVTCPSKEVSWEIPRKSVVAVFEDLLVREGSLTFRSWDGKFIGTDSDTEITFLAGQRVKMVEYGYVPRTYEGRYRISKGNEVALELKDSGFKWPLMVLGDDSASLLLRPKDPKIGFVMGNRGGAAIVRRKGDFWPFRPIQVKVDR